MKWPTEDLLVQWEIVTFMELGRLFFNSSHSEMLTIHSTTRQCHCQKN